MCFWISLQISTDKILDLENVILLLYVWKARQQTFNEQVMSNVEQFIITIITAIVVAFIPIIFKKTKPQDLLSEDIEEINNPDGSSIRKHKKKYK